MYCLINLDNDNVPECYLYDGWAEEFVALLTIKDDSVVELKHKFYYFIDFSVVPYGNVVCLRYYPDNKAEFDERAYYMLQNGEFIPLEDNGAMDALGTFVTINKDDLIFDVMEGDVYSQP